MTTSNRIPVLTPQGHLVLAPTDEARTLPDNLAGAKNKARLLSLSEKLAAKRPMALHRITITRLERDRR